VLRVGGLSGAKIETSRIGPRCRPFNLTVDSELPHQFLGLLHVAGGRRGLDRTLHFRYLAIRKELSEFPGGMIQQKSAERKQPQEEEKVQTQVVMQLAIPDLERIRQPAGRRFAQWNLVND